MPHTMNFKIFIDLSLLTRSSQHRKFEVVLEICLSNKVTLQIHCFSNVIHKFPPFK